MRSRRLLAVAAALFLLPPQIAAQGPDDVKATPAMSEVRSAELAWAPITPNGFDEGMQIAVVNGDPSAEGPYTLRLSFPDGYEFPAHWHPRDENLTVLSGTFLLGMGAEARDDALERYEPGDFLYLPATKPHFGGVEGYTVVQLHGEGPFEVYLAGEKPKAATSR